MRNPIVLIAALTLACAGADESPAVSDDAASSTSAKEATAVTEHADYSTPIVLFVSPDSLEVRAMHDRLGDDFYVTADDAMWYRSLAYELVDSLQLPHAEVGRGAARFLVDGEPKLVSWDSIDWTWFTIIYDGRSAPRFSADVDLRDVLIPVDSAGPVSAAQPNRGGHS